MNSSVTNGYHQKRRKLLRQCLFWGIVLPVIAMGLSIYYTESFEQRVIITALFAAAGFFAVAANVGPKAGIGAGIVIFIGALLGSIAFSWTIALTVALIGFVRMKQLKP